jgi:hypothetical protein
MESHALHADGLYYESGDKLWVNIYAPSKADWKSAQIKVEASTTFPEGDAATIKFAVEAPKEFTLALRRPFWAGEGFVAKVNGEAVKHEESAAPPSRRGPGRGGSAPARPTSSYVEIRRTWKSGDTVEVTLPKSLHLESLPDNPRRAAVMWGPLVLAGDLGPEQRGFGRQRGAATNQTVIPNLIAAEKPVAEWVQPVPDKPGAFRTVGVRRDTDVELVPFYRLHHRAYGVYWNLFTPEEWEKKAAQQIAAQEQLRKLEVATVAFAQPGEMQPERDFNFQGEDSTPVRVSGRTEAGAEPVERPGRRGSKWFSFDLPVDPTRPMVLAVTYNNDEQANRSFEIQVNGKKIAEQVVDRKSPEQVARFFEVKYPIPADLLKNRQKVTVRFQAAEGSDIAAVFGLRMLYADVQE